MTEKQIQYFEKALAAGNIAAAANELFISRSVVSRAILELEEEFGVKLFERSKSGIKPTDAGAMLHWMLVEITGSYKTLLERFKRMNDTESRRTLRVGVTPTNCRFACRLLFGEFHDRYPDVRISVTERRYGDLIDLLLDGEADVLLNPGRRPEGTMFGMMELYSVHMVLGVSESDSLASKKVLSVVDLIDRPLGFMSAPMPLIETTINNCFTVLKREPNVVVRTSVVEVLHELTREGRICVVLPDDMIREWDGVVGIPIDFASGASTHRIVWNNAVPLNSAAKDFLSFMREYKARHWAAEINESSEEEQ